MTLYTGTPRNQRLLAVREELVHNNINIYFYTASTKKAHHKIPRRRKVGVSMG